MNLSPPRGMRDFYPKDMVFRNHLFNIWKNISRLYGFEEYDTSIVETAELLRRKAGEEIDDQIYIFKDKSDNELALRPELTPSLARLIITKQNELSFPLRWFAIVQCFRYERSQKGRKREHYQWNLDILGEESPSAEAEVISAAVMVLKRLGLTSKDIKVRIGHRGVIHDLLNAVSFDMQYFNSICLALDKRDKLTDEDIKNLLHEESLPLEQIDRAFRILDIKGLDDLTKHLPSDTPSVSNLLEFLELCKVYEIDDFIEFDIGIIRGLAYYTGIVFEGFDTSREHRAVFGGGRYNNLLKNLGGKELPAVGFGFGDVVIKELLISKGLIGDIKAKPPILLAYLSPLDREYATRVATTLRNAQIEVDLALKPDKPKRIFSRASKQGIDYVILIGEEERRNNLAQVKDLKMEKQTEVNAEKLVSFLDALLK